MDVQSDMPLAAVVASANDNEKKHASELLDKVAHVVEEFSVVVADSQYSGRRVRDCIVEHGALPVVPYMSKQARDMPVLRVDRFFRVSGAEEERRVYGFGRASVERVNARLELVGLFEAERFEECLGSRVALYPCDIVGGCGCFEVR